MSDYFIKLLEETNESLKWAESQPDADRDLLNNARMAIYLAEQMLSQHPNCANDKILHFGFKAHLDLARKALQMIKFDIKERKKFAGLQAVNQSKRQCKLVAQTEAKKRWAKDQDQTIRLGDMCQLVWNTMVDDYLDELPDKPDGMKTWLRPLAPPYAKKPGRPKK